MLGEVAMGIPILRLLALLALAGSALPPASAQTLARFVPAAPETAGALELRFVRERAGRAEPQPWPATDVGWLFVREEGTQQNHDALAPAAEDATVLRLERGTPGPALVGWDPPPRIERTSAAELASFLAERAGEKGLPRAALALPAEGPVTVLRLESLALVARPGGAAPATVAASKSGQRMELRPLFDPGALAAGGDFVFRLYLPEGGADGLLCRAVQLETREALALERLPEGTLRMRLERPGPWMVEVSRVRALDGAAGAELELASTTLVFVVPPAKGGGR
jgi:hypothetical protein